MEFWKNTKYVSSFNHSLFFINVLISRKSKVCRRYRCEGEYPAMEFISSGCSAIAWYSWWCISQFQAWPTPPCDPPGIRTFSLPRGSGFSQLSLPGGSGFWIRKISWSFERKCKNFLIYFKETGAAWKADVIVLFQLSYQFLPKQ